MIPKNWAECPWFSHELILDMFIASKTFLDDSYNNVLLENERYQPKIILKIEKYFQRRVGMIIDLNNSTKYYNYKEVESMGKIYHKIACEGYNAAPSKDQVDCFIKICRNFEESYPDELILVHCTHGYNRTGFMITSYLLEDRMMDLNTSIEYFNKIRTPGIYKQTYINELVRMYGDETMKNKLALDKYPIISPNKPIWNLENTTKIYENILNPVNSTPNDTNCCDNEAKILQEPTIKQLQATSKTTTTFCIPGLNIFPASEEKALQIKNRLQNIFPSFRDGFPGSQPVSMDSNNVEMIKQNHYAISWKADGTRYLMYINGENEVYMIDRDYNIFGIPSLIFPQLPSPCTTENGLESVERHINYNNIEHVFDTLVDGEMIVESVHNNTKYPRFIIYDIIQLNGKYCGNADFWTRYHYIRVNLIDPRDFYIQKGVYPRHTQTFSVRRKQFYQLENSRFLFLELMPNLTHPNDGVIFQPVNEEYTPGTCPSILKWKPPSLNTIDFQLRIIIHKEPGCLIEKKAYLYLNGSAQPFGQLKYNESLNKYNNKVVECNIVNQNWNILRIREDKSFANSVSTARAVMNSILNPVTEKELFKILKID